MADKETTKPAHTIILDAGPIIKGEPSISTLLQQCERIVTLPSVISEIRDQQTRTRLETTILPFLQLQTPKRESVTFVANFARKTGDYSVLSKTDIEGIALAYDIECERNGGDWRLRNAPGQKRTNGPPPQKVSGEAELEANPGEEQNTTLQSEQTEENATLQTELQPTTEQENEQHSNQIDIVNVEVITQQLEATEVEASEESDSDGEWITPSNIKKKLAEDENVELIEAGRSTIQAVGPIYQDLVIRTNFQRL